MSMTEEYARKDFLEQNPAVVSQIEQLLTEPSTSQVGAEDDANLGQQTEAQRGWATPNEIIGDWPDPEPLGGELPAVEGFDLALLPKSLRPLVADVAERMQVPPDFPAAAALLSLACATGRRATIQPKAVDDSWVVVPNLWGAIVAPPGMLKSPLIAAITQPLNRIEAGWRADFEQELLRFEAEKEEEAIRQQAWKEQRKQAIKDGRTQGDALERPVAEAVAPACRRLITQDATYEKLHTLMAENPAGVFLIRDELTGWLALMDKAGREGERAFYLSAWSGDTPYTVDRVQRGSIHVPVCCVSILGGIQPARARAFLNGALGDGPNNDGLLQRFQVLVYPDIPSSWKNVDRLPDRAALERTIETYRRLTAIEPGTLRAFRFGPEAQELFNCWLEELETTKLRNAELHPALVGHLAKYRKLMPALSLLFHLADGGATEAVSLAHAQMAAAWCEYLESHARRLYAMIISPERQAAAELGRRLKAGWKRAEGMFTVRELYRKEWRGLSTPEEARRVLPLLEDVGWVRPAEIAAGETGRRAELWLINPGVQGGAR
ncbi:MAG: YfjI family protein [Terriglobales bacterium]|jgi:putative DNA primase/helicase